MNIKYTVIGSIFIFLGVWFYAAISTFRVDDTSSPERLIVREGTALTEREAAEELAKEMNFDLEGAYKSGFAPRDVIDFLRKEPHNFPLSVHEGRFYAGRRTVSRSVMYAICIALLVLGAAIIVLMGRKKKP